MVARRQTGVFDFADFLELIREEQKADLIDGNFYIASPESIGHNGLVHWLDIVIGQFVEIRGLGKVTVNKVAYRLTPDTAPEPDLAFVRTERVACMKRGYVEGPPDLAIEIVSPDSVDRDYERKRQVYEEAGVVEYWIIDPEESTAVFLVRKGNRFEESFPREKLFRSDVLPGFELDVRWLWQRPLPVTRTIVDHLLSRAGSQFSD